jgi:hypothetical protein
MSASDNFSDRVSAILPFPGDAYYSALRSFILAVVQFFCLNCNLTASTAPLPNAPIYCSSDTDLSPTASPDDVGEERRPKRGDDNYVPRPPNAFILFRSDYCSRWKGKKHPRYNLNTMAARQWNTLSSKERAIWEARAKEKEEEHKMLYPDYKYRPQAANAKNALKDTSTAASSVSTTTRGRNHSALPRPGGRPGAPILPLYRYKEASLHLFPPLELHSRNVVLAQAQSPMWPSLAGTDDIRSPVSSTASYYMHPSGDIFLSSSIPTSALQPSVSSSPNPGSFVVAPTSAYGGYYQTEYPYAGGFPAQPHFQ